MLHGWQHTLRVSHILEILKREWNEEVWPLQKPRGLQCWLEKKQDPTAADNCKMPPSLDYIGGHNRPRRIHSTCFHQEKPIRFFILQIAQLTREQDIQLPLAAQFAEQE